MLLYGYEIDNKGLVSPKLEEVESIQQIYKLYLKGCKLSEIEQFFKDREIKTRSGSNKLTSSYIRKILRKEKYLGDEKYPAIIDRKMFIDVKNKLKGNAKKNNKFKSFIKTKDIESISEEMIIEIFESVIEVLKSNFELIDTGEEIAEKLNPQYTLLNYKLEKDEVFDYHEKLDLIIEKYNEKSKTIIPLQNAILKELIQNYKKFDMKIFKEIIKTINFKTREKVEIIFTNNKTITLELE